MQKYWLLSIATTILPFFGIAQCISGDCIDGTGIFKYLNEATYQGEFHHGKPNGKGVFLYSNGNRYEGEWTDGKKSGKGELKFSNGANYKGHFENNFMSGLGVYTFQDGSIFKGLFVNDRPNGYGSLTRQDGSLISGIWEDGKLQPPSSTPIDSPKRTSVNAKSPAPYSSDGDGEVNIYAVIVGVSRYENFESLKYSDDDAYRIYAFLKSPEGGAIPDKNIHILIDESAVKENIIHAMKTVADKADEDDVIICYFAGHGLDGYFLPIDSDGYRRRIPYLSLRQHLESSAAKQKLFMADVCYSGSLLAARNPNLSQLQSFYDQLSQSAGGTAFLLSSKETEYSKEASGLRQGVFSYYLIEGMKGQADQNNDLTVTIEELYQFIRQGVRTYTKNEQTPMLAGQYPSDLPVSWVRK